MKKLLSLIILFSLTSNAQAVTVLDTTFTSNTETALGGGPILFGEFEFNLTNQTGTDWIGFSIFDNDTIGITPIELYVGPGTATFILNTTDPSDPVNSIDITGISILAGAILSFNLTQTCSGGFCQFGGTIWQGIPIIVSNGDPSNGNQIGVIPVPAAVWLFGTALVGLVGFSKRKSKVAL